MICRKLREGIRNDICPAISDMADVIPTFHKKNSFHCRFRCGIGLFGVVFQPDMKRLDKIVPVIEQLCLWCFLHILFQNTLIKPVTEKLSQLLHYSARPFSVHLRRHRSLRGQLHRPESDLVAPEGENPDSFPSVFGYRIICGTIFHVPFPAFSAVFVFDFKKNHFLLFVQQNAPDHGQ